MILIVTGYKYPNGDAGSLRVHAFAQVLKSLGYRTKVICNGAVTAHEQDNEGIKYISLRKKNRYISYYSFPYRCIKRVATEVEWEETTHIIAENLGVITFSLLKRFSRKKHISLIYDVVEWYSPSQFKLKSFAPTYLEKTLFNSCVIDNSVIIIAISSFLENYYKGKGNRTVRIPIFFKQELTLKKSTNADKIYITYAGQLGRKDCLWLMLKALSELCLKTKEKLTLNIVGCTEAQIIKLCQDSDIGFQSIADNVEIYGRVSHKEVIEILEKSHFSLLLRDAGERYAKAGFPTKVIESISHGVPPIMNFSSDLAMYFRDGIDCIEVKSQSIPDIHEAIMRAVSMTPDDYLQISKNAFALAKDKFDITSYVSAFRSILQ